MVGSLVLRAGVASVLVTALAVGGGVAAQAAAEGMADSGAVEHPGAGVRGGLGTNAGGPAANALGTAGRVPAVPVAPAHPVASVSPVGFAATSVLPIVPGQLLTAAPAPTKSRTRPEKHEPFVEPVEPVAEPPVPDVGFGLWSVNVLGSPHTGPRGDKASWPSGVVRARRLARCSEARRMWWAPRRQQRTSCGP